MNLSIPLLTLLLAGTLPVAAQNREPRLGYIYPAGGCRGSSFEAVLGGQFMNGAAAVHCSSADVNVEVLEYNRPLAQNRFNELRDELRALQEKLAASRTNSHPTNQWTAVDEQRMPEIRAIILKNPPNRQGNPALAERVSLKVTIAPDAEPGRCEIRLRTPNGLSNPLVFCVGRLGEFSRPAAHPAGPEIDRLRKQFGLPALTNDATAGYRITLPVAVNGQILPGAVDRYRFTGRKGQDLVVAASARTLIPYLADAVPGWFQATLALRDAQGRELAYVDDFRFYPDPVLHCVLPHDGDYVIEIKDAIYRGREDFVYRLELGELPFVTSVFPLGGPVGQPTTVELSGWNLPVTQLECRPSEPGIHSVVLRPDGQVSQPLPFFAGTLPECLEHEPNNTPSGAQKLDLPVTVNGRIGESGDEDVFRFQGRAGQELVVEVWARRLESPLDSVLFLTDASGRQLAFNDDHEDMASGLNTHHADSCLKATLTRDGTCFLRLADRQDKGGAEFAYRLRLAAPEPDYELRVVPSTINARSGASVPITVYALRREGFTNEIKLVLKSAPPGFTLLGGLVPAGGEQVKLTLAVPAAARAGVMDLELEGQSTIQGRVLIRPAVPADDLMQAFIYRHLVPAQELKLAVSRRAEPANRR